MSATLRKYVQQIVDQSDEPDRRLLAEQIAAAIPKSEQHSALVEAIQLLMPMFTGASRRAGLRRVVGSAKRALIRSEWEEFLTQNLLTPDGYKLMRDVTAIDLRAAAELRRSQAEALQVEAAKWDSLADDLEASGAATLGEMVPPLAA